MTFLTKALKAICEPSSDGTQGQAYRPQKFRLSTLGDRCALEELLRSRYRVHVYDTLLAQLRDLIRTRNPGRKLVAAELDSLAVQHLGNRSSEEYGVWFYYPWSNRLVHLLDESEFIELRTNRNLYKITPDEQAQLSRKRIEVVGLSVGQSAALIIALERSCGELRLADFDSLDLSNLNRIRAGVHSLGVPKLYITAREIAEIDPYLRVTCFPEGITEENCDAFLLQNSRLDVVVEECDSLNIKILLRHRARLHRIPVVMDTCDRGMLDVERFDLEPERAIFHGLIGDLSPDKLCGLTTEEKIPYVLQIVGVDTLSSRLRASLIEVEQSISTWPQLASAVGHGGAAAADIVRRICRGEIVRSGRYYADLEALIPTATESATKIEKNCLAGKPALEAAWMEPAIKRLPRLKTSRETSLTPDIVRRLVADATLAPSGGNCQPWKWVWDGDQLYLFHDVSRSWTPYDPEGRGGLVALGASTENLILSAHAVDLQVAFELFPCNQIPELVGRFRFGSATNGAVEPGWRDELYSLVGIRRTNRKLGSRRPLEPHSLSALTAAVHSVQGAEVCWLSGEHELRECGALLGSCDRLLFLTEDLNRFLTGEIRWTPDEAKATRDGISLESLELSPTDQAGLQLCRDWEALKFLRRVGGGHALEKASRKAVGSASAVGLLTVPQETAAGYFEGGRAVERLWLTAVELQLALHPMTSLPYLLAQLDMEGESGLCGETKETLRKLRPRYQKLFPVQSGCAHVFLFRLSHAGETSQRSLRRNLGDILSFV